MANNFTDSKSLDGEGLSLYDALIKHWSGVNDYTFATDEQIDNLFPPPPTLVSWSEGTDEEIINIIKGYYNNELTLDDIKTVWNVGDSREINIEAIPNSGIGSYGESHSQQTANLIIIDFDHDILTTTTKNKNKALITVQLEYCLGGQGSLHETSEEYGPMNSTNSNTGGWESCSRRNWCNTSFYNALPLYLKNAIKEVKKISTIGNQSSSIIVSSDKTFLLSETETIGEVIYSLTAEGTQYNYYKKTGIESKFQTDQVWLRSPHKLRDTGLSYFPSDGYCTLYFGVESYSYSENPTYRCGLIPAFCL